MPLTRASSAEMASGWGQDTIYCEATSTPEDVLYYGSEDEDYDDPETRKLRYEAAGQRFLAGAVPNLLSAALQGPFDAASGWRNPWRSKLRTSTLPTNQIRTQGHVPCESTSDDSRLRNVVIPDSLECHLPSPESLKQATLTQSHPFLEQEEVAAVVSWRAKIQASEARTGEVWFSSPAAKEAFKKRRGSGCDRPDAAMGKRRKTFSSQTSPLPAISQPVHRSTGILESRRKKQFSSVLGSADDLDRRISLSQPVASNKARRAEQEETHIGPHASFHSVPARLSPDANDSVSTPLDHGDDFHAAATLSSPTSLLGDPHISLHLESSPTSTNVQKSLVAQSQSFTTGPDKHSSRRLISRELLGLRNPQGLGAVDISAPKLTDGSEDEPETQRDESFCYKLRGNKESNGGFKPSNLDHCDSSSSISSLSSLDNTTWSGISNKDAGHGDSDVWSNTNGVATFAELTDNEAQNPLANDTNVPNADKTTYPTGVEPTVVVRGVSAHSKTIGNKSSTVCNLQSTEGAVSARIITSETQSVCSGGADAVNSQMGRVSEQSYAPLGGQLGPELENDHSTSADGCITGSKRSSPPCSPLPGTSSEGIALAGKSPITADLGCPQTQDDTSMTAVELPTIDTTSAVGFSAPDKTSCVTKSPCSRSGWHDELTLVASQSTPITCLAEVTHPKEQQSESQHETQSPWIRSQSSARIFQTLIENTCEETPTKCNTGTQIIPPELQSPWAPSTELLAPKRSHILDPPESLKPTSSDSKVGLVEPFRNDSFLADSATESIEQPGTPEPYFPVTSFASFMTPSPERMTRASQNPWVASNYNLVGSRRVPSSAMKNPWSSSRPKRVSWALLPEEHGQDLASQMHVSPSSATIRQNEHGKDRPASPPPLGLAVELPTAEDSRFSKHFNAVAVRKNHFESEITASGSCSSSDSLPISCTLNPDEHDENGHDRAESEGSEAEQLGPEWEKPTNIVEDLFREIGDVLQTWDLDAELDQAKDAEAPRASQMDVGLFGH